MFIAVLQQGLPRAIGENVVRRRLLGGVGVDFEGMRGEVLRDEVWGAGGGQGKETGRLYLYSKADEAVGWRDVERHIREARKLVKERAVLANKERGRGRGRREEVFEAGVEGLVRAERFEKASHCALVMEDEERYWRAVRESWEGHMERRRRRGRQSVDEGSKEVVLGATDEQGKEQMSDKEPRTKSGVVEDGVESREAEVSRRSRTSKL